MGIADHFETNLGFMYCNQLGLDEFEWHCQDAHLKSILARIISRFSES